MYLPQCDDAVEALGALVLKSDPKAAPPPGVEDAAEALGAIQRLMQHALEAPRAAGAAAPPPVTLLAQRMEQQEERFRRSADARAAMAAADAGYAGMSEEETMDAIRAMAGAARGDAAAMGGAERRRRLRAGAAEAGGGSLREYPPDPHGGIPRDRDGFAALPAPARRQVDLLLAEGGTAAAGALAELLDAAGGTEGAGAQAELRLSLLRAVARGGGPLDAALCEEYAELLARLCGAAAAAQEAVGLLGPAGPDPPAPSCPPLVEGALGLAAEAEAAAARASAAAQRMLLTESAVAERLGACEDAVAVLERLCVALRDRRGAADGLAGRARGAWLEACGHMGEALEASRIALAPARDAELSEMLLHSATRAMGGAARPEPREAAAHAAAQVGARPCPLAAVGALREICGAEWSGGARGGADWADAAKRAAAKVLCAGFQARCHELPRSLRGAVGGGSTFGSTDGSTGGSTGGSPERTPERTPERSPERSTVGGGSTAGRTPGSAGGAAVEDGVAYLRLVASCGPDGRRVRDFQLPRLVDGLLAGAGAAEAPRLLGALQREGLLAEARHLERLALEGEAAAPLSEAQVERVLGEYERKAEVLRPELLAALIPLAPLRSALGVFGRLLEAGGPTIGDVEAIVDRIGRERDGGGRADAEVLEGAITSIFEELLRQDMMLDGRSDEISVLRKVCKLLEESPERIEGLMAMMEDAGAAPNAIDCLRFGNSSPW